MRGNRKRRELTISEVIEKRRTRLITRQGYAKLLFRIIALALIGYLLFTQVFLVTQMSGLDMFPAMKDGDVVVVFRLQQKYERNDIVAYLVDGKRHFGRVIAASSDVVTMDDSGTLLVNGTPQSGEILYPTYAKTGIEYPYRVPDGCVFVLGEYRTQTQDSRDFGPITLDNVEGKLITLMRRRGL